MNLEKARNFICSTAAILLFAIAGLSATPSDYRERIESARRVNAELLADLVEGKTAASGADFDARKIVEIRRLLPAEETIKTESGEVEVSNKWLHSRLDEFVTEPVFMTRGAILSDIDERLASISWKLTELEIAAYSGRSKDEDKQKLAEILAREEFRGTVQQEKSLIQKLIDWFLELLDRLFSGMRPASAPNRGLMPMADGIRAVVLLVLIGLIGFALYKFAPVFFPEIRRRKSGESGDRVILGEKISRTVTAADLLAEAEAMANAGDLRGAIRKGYIALLCSLDDRDLIALAAHKTNRDYIRDLRGRSDLQKEMRVLTNSFELHWYGLQSAERKAWEEFRARFLAIAGRTDA